MELLISLTASTIFLLIIFLALLIVLISKPNGRRRQGKIREDLQKIKEQIENE